jgi:hypothetical protein
MKKSATEFWVLVCTETAYSVLWRRQTQRARTEATSLEYTRLSVLQDILFRYNLSMRNRGLIVYETLRK